MSPGSARFLPLAADCLRSGRYTQIGLLDTWPALAGWRGLRDPSLVSALGYTLYVVTDESDQAIGWLRNLVNNLELNLTVFVFDDDVELSWLSDRLNYSIPTLFYLWTPHPLLQKFQLNRIQLPEYEKAAFEEDK